MKKKAIFELTSTRHDVVRISKVLSMMLVMALVQPAATAAVTVDLGSASSFAVLAYSTITNTAGSTMIHGDVGVSTGTSITGFPPGIIDGTTHLNDALAISAKAALATAYNNAASLPSTFHVTELAGSTLFSGVYSNPSEFGITAAGVLTLDGGSDAVWIFKAGSTLITGAGSKINLINGAQASNVFWLVGSSATLGATNDFSGSILAYASITLGAGTTVDGRVLAQTEAVTMDSNTVTIPEPGGTLLLGFGMAGLFAFRRRVVTRS